MTPPQWLQPLNGHLMSVRMQIQTPSCDSRPVLQSGSYSAVHFSILIITTSLNSNHTDVPTGATGSQIPPECKGCPSSVIPTAWFLLLLFMGTAQIKLTETISNGRILRTMEFSTSRERTKIHLRNNRGKRKGAGMKNFRYILMLLLYINNTCYNYINIY